MDAGRRDTIWSVCRVVSTTSTEGFLVSNTVRTTQPDVGLIHRSDCIFYSQAEKGDR